MSYGGSWIFYNECYCLARWSYTCQHLYPALLPLNQASVFALQSQPIITFKVLVAPPWPPWEVLVGIILCLIQGKEGRIQALAGLALSSQTVAFILEDPGATKGGSYMWLSGTMQYFSTRHYVHATFNGFMWHSDTRHSSTMRHLCMQLSTIAPIMVHFKAQNIFSILNKTLA